MAPLNRLLQGCLVELGLAQQALELAMLDLEFAEPIGVRYLHAAVLGLPAVNAVFRNPMSPRLISRRGAGLVLLQDRNDLLFGIALGNSA